MALVVTSANGAISANATLVTLTAFTNPSSGGIGPRTLMQVDGEKMLVTDASLSPTLQVVRGFAGTLASAHNTLAPITYGIMSDWSVANGVSGAKEYSYGVSGAITVPINDCTIYLTKAGVAAMTLAGPAADQTNTVRFVSLTANAHTITYTAGFYANTTSSDVATFPSTAGAVFTIVARNGLWNAVATADDGVVIG